MDNKVTKHMSHQQIADFLGVSTKTIERRRNADTLAQLCPDFVTATKVNGSWVYEIKVDADVETDEPSVETPVPTVSDAEVNQLRSEVAHLRDTLQRRDEELKRRDAEIERQDSLLAIAMQQKGELISQLPPPRTSLVQRLKGWITPANGTVPTAETGTPQHTDSEVTNAR